MSLTWLDPIAPEDVPEQVIAAGVAHPMRQVTHAAAAEVGAWEGDLPRQVQRTFDELAGEWHTRHWPGELDALVDALDRGGVVSVGGAAATRGAWMELGAGDGWASATLAARAPGGLVSIDLSAEMLRRAPADAAPRLQADAARLPLDDHAVSLAVLMNMLLFPTELDRVLAPGGALLWLSSRGPATPIHLTPEQVVAAMPGRWGGVAARHGTAIWAVLRRRG